MLTVFPVTRGGAVLDPVVRQMVVVNEFKSGLYEVDHNRVYVPFDLLQEMMRMDAAAEVDPETGQPTGRSILARASEVVVRAKPGVTLDEVTQAAARACKAMEDRYGFRLRPRTWRDLHRSLLDAVMGKLVFDSE